TNHTSVPETCSLVFQTPRHYSCPSDEWQSIGDYLQLIKTSVPPRFQGDISPLGPNRVQVTGKTSIRHLQIEHLEDFWGSTDTKTTIATTPQATVADAMITLSNIFAQSFGNATAAGHGVPRGASPDGGSSIGHGYYQPYTVGTCAQDTIHDPGDERPLVFPVPMRIMPQYLPERQMVDSPLAVPTFPFKGLTRAELMENDWRPSENQLRWVELPSDPFNGSAIGAIVLLPKQASGSNSSQSQEIITCTLGAGWGLSSLNTSLSQASDHGIVKSLVDATAAMSVARYEHSVLKDSFGGEVLAYLQPTRNFLLPLYPNVPINVSESWSRYLNPVVADLNTTVFHQLMQGNLTQREPRVSAGMILTSLLANGLARIGIESSLQGDLKRITDPNGDSIIDANSWWQNKGDAFIVDPEESRDWVKLKIENSLVGYAYNITGLGPKFAIVFIYNRRAYPVHIHHITQTQTYMYQGISSSCWDSIGEVTALAMNSSPTALLRNTSSGITETNIFRLPARSLAKPDANGEGEHLELVLGEQDEKILEDRAIQVNRVYG
ncbi:MAG: hypothetical protein Q9169_006903, partial [Polycauliona sp. 2 TL-2023]